MNPNELYLRIIFISLGVFAVVGLMWFFLPYPLFIQGLLLGMLTSLLNAFTLILRTYFAIKQLEKDGKRSMATGMVQRLLFVGFAAYVTVKMPHLFSELGVLIGLFLVQAITLGYTIIVEYVIGNKKESTF